MVKCREMPYIKIGGSPLLGYDHGLPVWESALLSIRLLKGVIYNSPKTPHIQQRIPVAGPYSQHPFLQPSNTILSSNSIPIP